MKFDLFVGIMNEMVIYFTSVIWLSLNSAEVKAGGASFSLRRNSLNECDSDEFITQALLWALCVVCGTRHSFIHQ